MLSTKFNVRLLPIDAIIIPAEHRAVNADALPGLEESIKRLGMRTPIAVLLTSTSPLRAKLVAGRHRLEVHKRMGLDVIECLVLETEIEARLWGRSDNLHRTELNAQERAEELVAWMADVSALIPAQAAQVYGGRGQTGGLSEIARIAGIDRTEAFRAAAIVGISEEAKSVASELGLGDNQTALLQIARVDGPAAQVQKAQALAAQSKKKSATAGQEFTALTRAWQKSRASVRSRFLNDVIKIAHQPAKKTGAPQRVPNQGSDKKPT